MNSLLLFGLRIVAQLSLLSLVHTAEAENSKWVTIWGAMPQLTEPANLPPPPYNDTGVVFANATVRQTVMVTLDAETIRLEISNAFGGSDLLISAASIALPVNQSAGIGGIVPGTAKVLTFSGSDSFIIPNGAVVLSDPLEINVQARDILSISLYLENGQATNLVTSHPGSRTTSYFAPGDQVLSAELEDADSADHWYFISAVEGSVGEGVSAIAIIGDSITDGRGSTTNGNDRWPDQLLDRFLDNSTSHSVAIVNQAAGGNRILADGLGPNALGRIDRDLTAHPGIKHAIIFEGVNDIGLAATDEQAQQEIGDRILQAFDQIIIRLERHGISVYGATITPMSGEGQVYGHPNREKTRQRVNSWIRESGNFRAVLDFDKAVRDPQQLDQLREEYDTGDHLHLNPLGYHAMAASIDLSLFA